MELRALTLKVISAKNLDDVNLMTRMKVYVVVSLSGEVPSDQEFKTVVDREGRCNPHWNCSMNFTINERAHQLLVFSLRTERVLGDRDIGKVTIPVTDLLQSGKHGLTYATYQVTKPGKTSCGSLYFSYQLGDRIRINLGQSPATAKPTPATYDGPHHPYHVDVYPPPPKPLQFPPPITPPKIYDAYPPSIPPYLPCYPPSQPPPVNPYPPQSAYWSTPYPPLWRGS